ncbi:uncharacterized protein LOC133420775 [Cololabis saira]|uniref:uncharacterized protein LOC133420775 n=1 Tax=Cololabis saira TaxID=129043 RepID=UPI002AD2972D|nr:uncharacterized protein LOC133420775 [Cololabis saira]
MRSQNRAQHIPTLDWWSHAVYKMTNLSLTLALLCTLRWICVSVSEFHTVEVRPGEEVTLTCSNFSSFPSNIHWFKLADGTSVRQISSMSSSVTGAILYGEFQNGRFTMTSNTIRLYLNITKVGLNDSGLYFCGRYKQGESVISSATYLQVKGNGVSNFKTEGGGTTNLLTVTLGSLNVFFMILIVGFVVKIWQLHTAAKEGLNADRYKTWGSSHMNSAVRRFHPDVMRRRSHVDEEAVETHVTYCFV